MVTVESGATLSIGKKLQLSIPEGSLDQDTLISMEKSTAMPIQGELVPIGNSIKFGAHGLEFNKPVLLNACYEASALSTNGLHEDTVAVYYVDPQTGEYSSVGGTVNKQTHCVTAQLEHFSVYLIAAQGLLIGNNPPQIAAANFFPATPMANLPLKIRSVIRDFQNVTVNGQVGFGQVASATLYYRIPGEPTYTAVALTPDYLDDSAARFTYTIPANRVTTAGIKYYITAIDNLNEPRTRAPVTRAITRTGVGIAFQTNAIIDIAAGFKRSFTIRGVDDLGAVRNVGVDSFSLSNSIGAATKISDAVIQITATTTNEQNYRIGNLIANVGPFSVTSADIRVHAGAMHSIAFLSSKGVRITNQIDIATSSTYDFTVLGYDAFGNATNVTPTFTLSPTTGTGSIAITGIYNAPSTPQTLVLTASLAGHVAAITINIRPNDSIAWIKGVTAGSATTNFAKIISDKNDHILATGLIAGGYETFATFGPGISLVNPRQYWQPFFVMYDFLGNTLWAKLDSAYYAPTENMTFDNQGNFYTARKAMGSLGGGISTHVFGPSVSISGVVNGSNALLVKHDASGNAIWARMATTPDVNAISYFRGAATDQLDNVYAIGLQSMNAAFSYGAGVNLPALTGSWNESFVLVKYDSAGNTLWAVRQLNPACRIHSRSIATDASGNVLVAGFIVGTALCDLGSGVTVSGNDVNIVPVLLKYGASGNALWAKAATSLLNASSAYDYGEFGELTLDQAGNIYITGTQYGTKSIDYGNGVVLSAPYASGTSGAANGTILKFDSNGNALWGRTLTSASGRSGFSGPAVDSVGNIYISGTQIGAGTYTYGPGVSITIPAAPPAVGIYIKYDSAGNALWIKTGSGGNGSSFFRAVVDSADRVFFGGYNNTNDLVTYGPGITYAGPAQGNNAFIMRYIP